MSAATVEGSPKTPLPMIEFTTSATRLQRPMARIRSWAGWVVEGVSIRVFVPQMDAAGARVWAPRFALAWTAEEAVTTWPVRRTEGGDFRADADCTVDC